MRGICLLILLSAIVPAGLSAQPDTTFLHQVNSKLPHKFKEIRIGATIEAERKQETVQVYVLIDDIEQYDEVMIERSDVLGTNFAQCKVVKVVRGKYPDNYIEVTDQYPVSSKMSNLYRVKTVSPEGIVRMYAPVAIIGQ